MPEYFGTTGKLLRIDMTAERTSVVDVPEDVLKLHVGGNALALYYLFKEGVVAKEVTPFDAKNVLYIMVGPLGGVGPGTQSVAVTKAPHNFFCSSYSGGLTMGELKFAGYDGVAIVGKAKDWLWVSIVDDKVGFNDAKPVLGKGAAETELWLKQRVQAMSPLEYRVRRVLSKENTPTGTDAKGNKVSMWDWWGVRANPPYAIGEKKLMKDWVIGPAGENLSWYAAIMTEGTHAHGRYGSGAIMGSKNLKAITVRGTKGHRLANKAKAIELIRNVHGEMKKAVTYRTYGTARVPAAANNVEDAYPIRNYKYCAWHDPRAVGTMTGGFLDDMSWVKHTSCCTVGCLNCFKSSRVTHSDPTVDGTLEDMVDWEAQGNVGGLLDCVITADQFPGKTPADPYLGTILDKMEAANRLLYMTYLYDDNGLCYIEGGCHVGLLMELRELGLITKEDLGLPADVGDLTWGNYKAVAWVIKQMCTRKDAPWDAIKKGTYETAKYFADKKGKPEIMKYQITIKRFGQPAHDPRSGRCKGPADYSMTERPGAHTEGTGVGVPTAMGRGCLVACSFSAVSMGGNAGFAAQIEAYTGWTFKEADYLTLGARAYTQARAFNLITQGIKDPFTEWDNLWPRRWLDPLPTGWARGTTKVTEAGIKDLMTKFLADRGCDAKGYPTAATLAKYGITYVDDYLKALRGT